MRLRMFRPKVYSMGYSDMLVVTLLITNKYKHEVQTVNNNNDMITFSGKCHASAGWQ